MRLRDVFRYFCWECWTFFIILSLVWLFFAGIFVIALISGQMVMAALMALALSVLASGIIWAGYNESLYHYRGGA